jgi:hypothetical protein
MPTAIEKSDGDPAREEFTTTVSEDRNGAGFSAHRHEEDASMRFPEDEYDGEDEISSAK